MTPMIFPDILPERKSQYEEETFLPKSKSLAQSRRIRQGKKSLTYVVVLALPKVRFITGELSLAVWKSTKAKHVRELEAENAKLKKLLADRMLENEAMKGVLSKSGNACE